MCKIVYQTYNNYGKGYTYIRHCTLKMLPEIKAGLERKGCTISRITYTSDINFRS